MTAGETDAHRPAVTGAPIGSTDARREAITGDDSSGDDAYPADRAAPDRGSSALRDET